LAYSNTSIDTGIIGRFWIITDIDKSNKMKYRMYSKA